jgi:GMP synthase (glutamine-hydrolysing)
MHVPQEGLGAMEAWFVARGHALSRTRFFMGETPPAPGEVDWLVVMGGPMGVYEEDAHPWLRAEKAFIASVLEHGRPALGVCLGAQLLAEVLGGEVRPNGEREIGWFPVSLTEHAAASPLCADLPTRFTPLHWHGDTFTIPPGAVHVARSEACENQAFVYEDRVLGLQFHLEAMPSVTEGFWEADCETLGTGRYVQTAPDLLGSAEQYAAVHPIMSRILERFEALDLPR